MADDAAFEVSGSGSGSDDSDFSVTDYIDGGNVRWAALASTLMSSLVLAYFDGAIKVWSSIFEGAATLLSAGIGWFDETTTLLFSEPQNSLGIAWSTAAAQFPVAGPLDFVLGVLLIMASWYVVRELAERIREGT